MAPEELSQRLSESVDISNEICQNMPSDGQHARIDDITKEIKRPTTVCSAPSSTKIYAVTPEIQQTISLCANKKSNSFVENRYKCTITSDRLAQLKKIVDTAVKDHKVFTIKGKESKVEVKLFFILYMLITFGVFVKLNIKLIVN